MKTKLPQSLQELIEKQLRCLDPVRYRKVVDYLWLLNNSGYDVDQYFDLARKKVCRYMGLRIGGLN